jgi:hypothetical protein
MLDIKRIEKEVIDDLKPDLIIKYLIINEINIIPKEVNWLFIETLLMNEMIAFENEKNAYKFFTYCNIENDIIYDKRFNYFQHTFRRI